ncbi:MAG TPA: extracellular solute-binding protein [Chloroflexota bacterium]|nr:extracellular solute-binding protein [Chloroflexota bacterium]
MGKRAHCLAAALLGVWSVACSGGPPASRTEIPAVAGQTLEQRLYEGAKKEGKLVWWFGSPAAEANEFIKAFQAHYPEIQFDYDVGDAGNILQKFMLEVQAKKVSVDIMNVDQYAPVRALDAAADLSDIATEMNLAPHLITADKKALQITFTVDGIGYNTNLVKPADIPRTWTDILDPKWKGSFTIEQRLATFTNFTDIPEYNGTRPGLWSEEKMADFLARVKAQNPRIVNSHVNASNQLAAGETPLIFGVHLNSFRRPQAAGAPIDWAPLDTNIVDSTVNILAKDAPHPNAGRLFYLWSLSPEGMKVWDDIRQQGDPTPGSGSSVAKYLEERGIKPVFAGFEIQNNVVRLQKKYRDVLGIPS